MPYYNFTVYANSTICKTFSTEAQTPEEARDLSFDKAQKDINEGNLEDWDMTTDTEIYSGAFE